METPTKAAVHHGMEEAKAEVLRDRKCQGFPRIAKSRVSHRFLREHGPGNTWASLEYREYNCLKLLSLWDLLWQLRKTNKNLSEVKETDHLTPDLR